MAKDCCCGDGKVKLIYACSGGANTGSLTDSVARKLMGNGTGRMTCLAGVGAGLSGFLESAKSSEKNIVIDGCPVSCGKIIFENAKLPYQQFILTEFGVEKGKTMITQEVIERVSAAIAEKV